MYAKVTSSCPHFVHMSDIDKFVFLFQHQDERILSWLRLMYFTVHLLSGRRSIKNNNEALDI